MPLFNHWFSSVLIVFLFQKGVWIKFLKQLYGNIIFLLQNKVSFLLKPKKSFSFMYTCVSISNVAAKAPGLKLDKKLSNLLFFLLPK